MLTTNLWILAIGSMVGWGLILRSTDGVHGSFRRFLMGLVITTGCTIIGHTEVVQMFAPVANEHPHFGAQPLFALSKMAVMLIWIFWPVVTLFNRDLNIHKKRSELKKELFATLYPSFATVEEYPTVVEDKPTAEIYDFDSIRKINQRSCKDSSNGLS